ncbi:MAG: UDP-glucose 4-epimerase [Thermoleophilaceae bacterium]|jgi:UDP-glucose 4-epimerase|nr:UDP-glucose 4-epimerase [Thermoleophilaceae bacterium]
MTQTTSKRILITGLSTYWGARLARELEQNPDVDAIIGVDSADPAGELERTEFVRVGTQHALLRRVVDAAEVDTVIDTRLVVDSTVTTPRRAHENNVIGTMNILAACSGPESPVRKLLFKSSAHYYGCNQDDPAFFTESMGRPHPPRTSIERDIVEAEASVADFREKNPDVSVTTFRFANVLGPDVQTAHTNLFDLPVIPMILGFDPRYQFVHEDDVVNALLHAALHDLPGTFNVAGDGVLAFTEVCSLLGKQFLPVLPPWGTGVAAQALRRFGVTIPPDMLSQLRFGRGQDNRRFKATGFGYRYTTRETVQKLGEHLRLQPILAGVREPYRYEREVEEFLRWSPYVRRQQEDDERPPMPNISQLTELQKFLSAYADAAPQTSEERAPRAPTPARAPEPEPEPPHAPVDDYDDLEPEEVISLLGSLEREDLTALREYEASAQSREPVLRAIDAVLARREPAATR